MSEMTQVPAFPAYVLHADVITGPEFYINGSVMRIMKRRGRRGYWRMGRKETFLLLRLDGRNSLEQISEQYRECFGRELPVSLLQQTIEKFAEYDLLERISPEPALASDRPPVAPTVAPPSLFNLKILSWDPDEFLARIAPNWSWLANGWVQVAWGLLIVLCELLVIANFRAIWHEESTVSPMTIPVRVVALVLIVMLTFTLHEGGHAIVCKCYGGQVPEMGFLLRYFLFTPFTNVDDIVLFADRRARLCVLMVGPLISLTTIPLALLFWLFAPPGNLAHLVSSDLLIWFNLVTLLQFVPFVQTDGYFALAQLLRMPDLMKDSYIFLLSSVFPKIVGRKMTVSADCPAYVKPMYVAFGLLSVVATTTVVIYAIASYANVLSRLTGEAVSIAIIGVILAVLIVRFVSQLARWTRARV